MSRIDGVGKGGAVGEVVVGELRRNFNHLGELAKTVGDLRGPKTVIHELVQNADDAGASCLRFSVARDSLTVWNNASFSRCIDLAADTCTDLATLGYRCDFHSFRDMASGDKRARLDTTGAFGIGFQAVYQLTDRPELISSGEHWRIEEKHDGGHITQLAVADPKPEGTTFRLPWARQPSTFRLAIHQEVITDEYVVGFAQMLRDEVGPTLPFLRHLEEIEVVDEFGGYSSCTVRRRSPEGGCVVITRDGDPVSKWRVFSISFEESANELKAAHPSAIEPSRSTQVVIAVPAGDGAAPTGLLYATLPTEETISLPMLINADFYPASDRKRIRWDDAPESAYNRAAIQAAADCLAQHLDELPDIIGDAGVIDVLVTTRSDARQDLIKPDPCFGAFWERLHAALGNARIVPTISGGRVTTTKARLWRDDSEAAAAPVLHDLGVELVDPKLKDRWYELRGKETGVAEIALDDFTDALRVVLGAGDGVTRPPRLVGGDEGVRALLGMLDVLVGTENRRSVAALQQARRLRLCPNEDGQLCAFGHAIGPLEPIRQLLRDAGVAAPFADVELLSRYPKISAHLLSPFNASGAARLLADASQQGRLTDRFDSGRLLSWLARSEGGELPEEDEHVLAHLAVFPTGAGLRPLSDGLFLPGGFSDPLGAAQLVVIDPKDRAAVDPFLERLGAERLTLRTYCTSVLPDLLAGRLDIDRLEQLLELLVTNWSQLREDEDVRAALSPLPLVACLDGQWRRAGEVYLPVPNLERLLGATPVARLPEGRRQNSVRDFYTWLGAATKPRPADIIQRCRLMVGKPSWHKAAAVATVEYLSREHASDPAFVEAHYGALRTMRWLPAEGNSDAWLPGEVFSAFRRSLFASQGRFVDIPYSDQRAGSDFLAWLGVRSEPSPAQVVDHLLHCSRVNQIPGSDLWAFLDLHASEPDLDRLERIACLPLAGGRWVRPDSAYTVEQPFGRWRHLLDESFGRLAALMRRLGVAERPQPADAIDVLGDIAADHGGEDAPPTGEDVAVVHKCWRMLTDALAAGTIAPELLAGLGTVEAVLTRSDRLRTPANMLFSDAGTTADRFGPEVVSALISRTEGEWPALASAGVRNLTDAADVELLELEELSGDSELAHRARDRHLLLSRVVSVDATRSLRAQIDTLHVVPVRQLKVRLTVELAGRRNSSEAHDRRALWNSADGVLYSREEDLTSWTEHARELARAVGVADMGPQVAAGFKVVLEAPDAATAAADLDGLDYPALEADVQVAGVDAAPQTLLVQDGSASEPTEAGDEEELDGEGGVPAGTGAAEAGRPDGATRPGGTSPGAGGTGVHPDSTDEQAGGSTSQAAGAAAQPEGSPANPAGAAEGSGTADAAQSPGQGRGDQSRQPDRQPGDGQGTVQEAANGQARPAAAKAAGNGGARSVLRSYVVTGQAAGERADDGRNAEVDRAGMDAVLDYERARGRRPEPMPHDNPGYDIKSTAGDGLVRFIEVKSTAAGWSTGVRVSDTQFRFAQDRTEEFWLYVVEHALDRPTVTAINDPASRVTEFIFDDGWRAVAAHEPAGRPPLPGLPLETEGGPGLVPFFSDPAAPGVTGGAPDGWVRAPVSSPGVFAVRITGEGLGLRYRGGVALIDGGRSEPVKDEFVLVVLDGQIDQDTGSTVTIRLWDPIIGAAGDQQGLRLRSDGSVEPLTVQNPASLRVLGTLVGRVDPYELGLD